MTPGTARSAASSRSAPGHSPTTLEAAGSIGTAGHNLSYASELSAAGLSAINRKGLTQVPLRFQLDDNDDRKLDCLRIASGNAAPELRPVLEVRYTLP
jgi:hypothetical protein